MGTKIKVAIKKSGMQQRALAFKLGISEEYLSRIARGKKIPSVPLLKDIAKELHCKMDDLI